MLHARIDVVQILDRFQVAAELTEFTAGQDPVVWSQRPLLFTLEDLDPNEDALYTAIRVIRIWSEMTISE